MEGSHELTNRCGLVEEEIEMEVSSGTSYLPIVKKTDLKTNRTSLESVNPKWYGKSEHRPLPDVRSSQNSMPSTAIQTTIIPRIIKSNRQDGA
jgi:hypothetical protein